MRLFWIQGLYWQMQSGLAIGYKENEGLTALFRKGLVPSDYAGTIWGQDNDHLTGGMRDDLGKSHLSHIIITDGELSFSKRYEKHGGHPDKYIRYSFLVRDGNKWSGEYSFPTTPDVPGGRTVCLLTEVDQKWLQGPA